VGPLPGPTPIAMHKKGCGSEAVDENHLACTPTHQLPRQTSPLQLPLMALKAGWACKCCSAGLVYSKSPRSRLCACTSHHGFASAKHWQLGIFQIPSPVVGDATTQATQYLDTVIFALHRSNMDDNLEELLKEFGDLPTSTGSTHDRLSSKSAGRSSFPAPQQPLYTKSQLDSSRPAATAAKQTPTITLTPANYSSAKQQQQGSIGPPINMQPQQNSTAAAVRQPRSSLDDLLDDLEAVGPLSPSTERASAPGLQGPGHHRFPSTSSTAASGGAGGARSGFRCMGGMFLGGSAAPRGRNGSIIGSVTCCDSIRCTKCDFKVVVFDNQAWHKDVDYLFFRWAPDLCVADEDTA
jgi:hypothetical protein